MLMIVGFYWGIKEVIELFEEEVNLADFFIFRVCVS